MNSTTSKIFSTAKWRPDIDRSEMTASDIPTSDITIFDENTTGLYNLDCQADFNFTDLLGDFDDGEGLNYFFGQITDLL